MTAEVAIMNTMGIAMAADSAVTLGVGKTYNTADKLFALSKYHPVGIMMYSSSTMMGIEWETIIKSYRDSLGQKAFDTLSEYAGDFISYLTKFPYITEEQMVDYMKSVGFGVFNHVLSWFWDDLHKEFDGKEPIEQDRIDTVFNAALKEIKDTLKKTGDEKQIRVDEDFIDRNIEAIKEMAGLVFEKYPLTKKQISDLVTIYKMNFRKCGWIDSSTGIVIAGYGEREIFPTIHEFEVGGKIGKSLLYFNEDIDTINHTHNASICPYAQTEMVHQFAKGIDPDFGYGIIDKADAILKSLSGLLKDSDKAKAEKLTELLKTYIDDTIDKVYVKPILDIVGSMQKSELAAMAEAMVNLTALKRHVTNDPETVGGPVDVAIISKGDGFIWIKRKTNYDPTLNLNLHQSFFHGGER
jgi:hypothetical protein